MVLGQCLEVLRANQQKMAAPTPVGGKKRLAMVPFRHSKLTEIFQNFFVGDGRAVSPRANESNMSGGWLICR
jgi:kinesin family protein 20